MYTAKKKKNKAKNSLHKIFFKKKITWSIKYLDNKYNQPFIRTIYQNKC